MKLFRPAEGFRILIIAAMMASLAAALGELARRVLPAFDPTALVALSFLVCLEGIASDRLLRQLPEAGLRLRLRLVEWVVILLLLRLVLLLMQGPQEAQQTVARWLAHPQTLLDAGLVVAALLMFLVWMLGLQMARALEALGPEAEEAPPKDSAAYYAWLTRPRASAADGWSHLTNLVLGGGALLLVSSGLARLDIPALLNLRNPAIAGIVLNALLYFALAFLLLAQGHYARLKARWERGAVPVSNAVGRRWVVLGLLFVLGLALLVLLLPVRPSLALFGAAFDAIQGALGFLFGLMLTIFAAIGYLLSLLGSLFGGGTVQEEGALPMQFPTPAPQESAPQVAWWEAIQGLLLWALIVIVVGYALVRFVRERQELIGHLLRSIRPLAWAARLLSAAWHWLAGAGRQVRQSWRRLTQRPATGALARTAAARTLWWRPRDDRERVRLLYLAALQHMAQAGWPRRQADTPQEYAERLAGRFPEGEADLGLLTDGFVHARYSRREIAHQEVSIVRAAWLRLRRMIR